MTCWFSCAARDTVGIPGLTSMAVAYNCRQAKAWIFECFVTVSFQLMCVVSVFNGSSCEGFSLLG